ncbi:hypothetical protein ACFQYP_32775 [Nonomuraea antimicrobica]
MTAEPEVVVVGGLNMDLRIRVPRLPSPGETVPGGRLDRGTGGKEPTRRPPPGGWARGPPWSAASATTSSARR